MRRALLALLTASALVAPAVAEAHRAPYGDAHYIARLDAASQCGRGISWVCLNSQMYNGTWCGAVGDHSWNCITHIYEASIYVGTRYCDVYTRVEHWSVASSNKYC